MQLPRPLVAVNGTALPVTEPQEMEILLFAFSLRGLSLNNSRDGTDKHGLCVFAPWVCQGEEQITSFLAQSELESKSRAHSLPSAWLEQVQRVCATEFPG